MTGAGAARPGRQAEPFWEVDGQGAADRAQQAAGLGGAGDEVWHGRVLQQDEQGAGAGGGVGHAGVDPAAFGWQAWSGRAGGGRSCGGGPSGGASLTATSR